jgi:predicted SprT family Zn-dependent metalloprotease
LENNYKIYHQQKEKISHKHKDFIWLFLHIINPLPSTFHPSLIQHVQDNKYHHQQRDFTNDQQQISS